MNLGNALEAPGEGQWGVILKEEYFRLIKDAGFDTVRIPIRWSAHAGNRPPYSIDECFFNRVDWAVFSALGTNMNVVINIHHYEELTDRPDSQKDRFLSLWQ
jgi:endoglucanase